MELWLLFVMATIGVLAVLLVVVELGSMYGGDWANIQSTLASAVLIIAVMVVAIVVVSRAR